MRNQQISKMKEVNLSIFQVLNTVLSAAMLAH